MTTYHHTHYNPRWPHRRFDRRPTEDGDAVLYPRVVRREWTFDPAYPRPVLCEVRYSPHDREAAVFVYEEVGA